MKQPCPHSGPFFSPSLKQKKLQLRSKKRIQFCIRLNLAWLIFSTTIWTTAAITAVKIPVKNTTSHRLMNFNVVSFCIIYKTINTSNKKNFTPQPLYNSFRQDTKQKPYCLFSHVVSKPKINGFFFYIIYTFLFEKSILGSIFKLYQIQNCYNEML